MQCRYCESTKIQKNGKGRGKQNYKCVSCGRQFIDVYNPPKGYSDEIKKECLMLYLDGMGFRAIERKLRGLGNCALIRYADDWLLLTNGGKEEAFR